MKGLLIVNSFLGSSKYTDIYDLLLQAAKKYDIDLDMAGSGELIHNLSYLMGLPYDFILFWDKDIILAEMLEKCGFRLFNSMAAIRDCDSKAYTALRLDEARVRTPRTIIAPLTFEAVGYNELGFLADVEKEIGYPMIIKELYGSFSKQVYLASNHDEALGIISSIGCKGFLMQEFVASSFGRDIRVNVVGDRVVSAMLRHSVNGDFRSNISIGGHAEQYEINDAQASLAIRAAQALGLDFAGVDVLFGPDGEPIICEVNSNPHFKSTLECTGLNMAEPIMEHIVKCLGAGT